ncbi:TetR/AcrR family transcriptional regulator [Shimazuella kribbensis]|uniref:TetR/AcrR family transcriptional regulator n=1 Tax=Shimazuella kribbensis TaxID=139808 RepID=UPI00041F922E|nr:TetR/AcrR family transcriptional regulator [Shimazuella kribbensis]
MLSKFDVLESEKQERILNAAMKEFAEKGFQHASTNQIVANAGISKGLLFHYFSNKKALYLYLYEYSTDKILEDFFGQIDFGQNDILLRLREMLVIKFRLMNKYPVIFDFLMIANRDEAADEQDLKTRNQAIMVDSYEKLFASIDESLFRKDIDPGMGKQIIIWTIEGISNQVRAQDKHKKREEIQEEATLAELDAYLDILRKTLYI